jgi:hypothetical protein
MQQRGQRPFGSKQHQSLLDFLGYISGHAWRYAMPRKPPFRNEKGRTRSPCLHNAYAGPFALSFSRN